MPDRGHLNLSAFRTPWPYVALAYVLLCGRFYQAFIFEEPGGTVFGMADDVYITACYARSFVEGHGWSWYAGAPRVEGFTSPVWVLVLAALHLLPGHHGDVLGLQVVVVNAALLVGVVYLVFHILRRYTEATRHLWLAAPVLLGGAGLCYWASEGFEVVMVAVLALSGMLLATQPLVGRRAVLFGVLLGLSMWTRMDAVVYWSGACVMALTKTWRESPRDLVRTGAIASGIVVLGFALRYMYFGEWLPNTYYLKVFNWPLHDRLKMGLERNASLFLSATLIWLPLSVERVRRALGPACGCIAACFLAYTLSVIYSTHNGGDAWKLLSGHDRYTSVGSVFLMLGLCLVVVGAQVSGGARLAIAFVCAGLAVHPIVEDPKFEKFYQDRIAASKVRPRALERKWIQYGKVFAEISEPRARIAVCAAGAAIYFSRRGGVDLLGKIDPYVARLKATSRKPTNSRCWQNNPGHNKVDDAGVYKRRNPDFSRIKPPVGYRDRYHWVKYKGLGFHVRKDTPYARNLVGP